MPKREPSSGHQDGAPATTPAARLRRIEAVLRDANLTRAEGQAVIAVVLHANGSGLAWPGQRRLRSLYRLSGPAVTGGLRKAVGKHLAEAGIGPRGVRRYRVLDVPPNTPPGRENELASVPVSGALTDPPARRFSPSSAPVSESSAPVSPRQRARDRHETKKNQGEPKEGEPERPPPPVAALGDENSDRPDAEPADPGEALWTALGREPTAKERSSFDQAVAEALAAGATDALIAHFTRRTPPSEGVWTGPNAARSEARRLVESWANAGIEPRRESVAAIIKDVLFAEENMRQEGLPSWDAGRARNEKVLAWGRREAAALQAADVRAALSRLQGQRAREGNRVKRSATP